MLRLLLILLVVLSTGLTPPSAAAAANSATEPRYPDLKTLPPRDLRFDTVTIDGAATPVLRFANSVWNAGQGPLHLVAKTDRALQKTQVFQRIYANTSATGRYIERHVGDFVFHAGHNHFHFENFAEYQLWKAADWDGWTTSRTAAIEATQRKSSKTTFCIMDTDHTAPGVAGSPATAAYTLCSRTVQGLSVGWGDTYGANLADQWITLPSPVLPDGSYVLRSVADPLNQLYESANQLDTTRESRQANENITRFSVCGGVIAVPATPC